MNSKVKKYLNAFFLLGMIEISAEYFAFLPIIILIKPLLPLLLLFAFKAEFGTSKLLFNLILISSCVTNVLFIWVEDLIFWGVTIFTIHRILMIVFLIQILKIKDFIPLILATIPFMLFAIYIFLDVEFQSSTIQYFIFVQNCMISVLGGMALSQYVLKDSSKITWLMLSVFLFFCLHFLVFIELFYVRYNFMRSLAMLLNITAFFAFYKYVVTLAKEELS